MCRAETSSELGLASSIGLLVFADKTLPAFQACDISPRYPAALRLLTATHIVPVWLRYDIMQAEPPAPEARAEFITAWLVLIRLHRETLTAFNVDSSNLESTVSRDGHSLQQLLQSPISVTGRHSLRGSMQVASDQTHHAVACCGSESESHGRYKISKDSGYDDNCGGARIPIES